MPALAATSSALQFGGGLNGGSTEFAHLYMVACMDVARARKLSFGALFVGLQTAFASIARILAFPAPPASMDAFVARLLAAGFTAEDAAEMAEGLCAYEHWTASGGTKHYLTMLSKLHRQSWFAMEGVAGCVQTASGSLAGNALGDCVFLLAFSRVIHAVELRPAVAGLRFDLPVGPLIAGFGAEPAGERHEESVQLGAAGYMDDVVQPLFGQACEIVDKTDSVCDTIRRRFLQVWAHHQFQTR